MNEAAIIVLIVVYILLLGGVITVAVFYLKNLQDTLKEVSPKNRQVEPGNVWLMFIPLFNIVYPFILYPKISDSLRAEFTERGRPQAGDYYRSIGITMPILGLCGVIPLLGVLASIGNLVLWIMYWVKMAEFKKLLRSIPKTSDSMVISDSTDLLD